MCMQLQVRDAGEDGAGVGAVGDVTGTKLRFGEYWRHLRVRL
jgi:hypothetical protein